MGAAAYAAAFLELLDQFERLKETLDAVVVPTVSGGTLAGLLLGVALSAWKGRIIGISAGDKAERAIRRVRTPQLAAAEILGMPSKVIGQTPIVFDDRFVGEDYGIPTPNAFEQSNSSPAKKACFSIPFTPAKRWPDSSRSFAKITLPLT